MRLTATEMARHKFDNSSKWIRWTYRIKNNPYHREHPLHAKWHNEFYDECRRLGRSI